MPVNYRPPKGQTMAKATNYPLNQGRGVPDGDRLHSGHPDHPHAQAVRAAQDVHAAGAAAAAGDRPTKDYPDIPGNPSTAANAHDEGAPQDGGANNSLGGTEYTDGDSSYQASAQSGTRYTGRGPDGIHGHGNHEEDWTQMDCK